MLERRHKHNGTQKERKSSKTSWKKQYLKWIGTGVEQAHRQKGQDRPVYTWGRTVYEAGVNVACGLQVGKRALGAERVRSSAARPWASYFTSLSANFITCKMGITQHLHLPARHMN